MFIVMKSFVFFLFFLSLFFVFDGCNAVSLDLRESQLMQMTWHCSSVKASSYIDSGMYGRCFV